MSNRNFLAPKFAYVLGPAIVAAMGVMTIASAQSPFANKKKTQAWETPQTTTPPVQISPYQAQSYQTKSYQAQSGTSAPSQAVSPSYQSSTNQPRVYGGEPQPYTASSTQGSTYSGSSNAGTSSGAYHYQAPQQPQTQGAYNYQAPNYERPTQARPTHSSPQNSYPQSGQAQYTPTAYQPQTNANPYPVNTGPRTWKEKLGLGSLATSFKGFLKGGVAAVRRDNGTSTSWSEEFIADAKGEFEVSAVTDSGYEYGVNLEARSQYDRFRRGFGGRISDCPPTVAGCLTVDVNGTPTSLRGHTSRFYTNGVDDAKDVQFALESAHLFLRSSYGDVTLGRDDGAAYLFSLGAPSLLSVGASNSSVDYTGLDSVKTVNDASGFSEKITYTTPRLLGDTVGFGVQLGASYALNARACGVDYCVKENDVAGTISPDLEDIFEVGISVDRTFDNGLSLEATATYATGSEQSGLAVFDDLQAYNFGAEMSWADITLGGSFLKSNNGLLAGDYEAWDVGATWKPSALGFTLGYGHATDEGVNLSSDQFVAGLTYDFNKFTLGAGAQYSERETQAFNSLTVLPQKEKATALFVEGGFKF